ncbi:YjhX family toxin [Burkholderia alba]|uniref:YjhX family toxin n=1 Tax=Burkholderia alba TaxID=2683677 RepID=UPI002B055881|nr:YjhX family toxin [Burkholderia alba]
MNISKQEQRVLHVLAQGGAIHHLRVDGQLTSVDCFNRHGLRLSDCTLDVFKKLKRRGFIASIDSGPYRITRLGRESVRPQLDNQLAARGR